ncbi:hypothetical protein ACHAXT_002911 [Thalassiosira profunda]
MGKKSRRRSKPATKGEDASASGVRSFTGYVPDTSGFGPPAPPAAVAAFWTWFQEHELALRHPDLWSSPDGTMQVMERVCKELVKVHDGLSCEIGRSLERYHVVITANGNTDRFNAVISLIQAAPTNLAHWRLTAFRPRSPYLETLSFPGGGWRSSPLSSGAYPPEKMSFMLTEDKRVDKLGVLLFMEGFEGKFDDLPRAEQEFFGQAAFLYLDSILGEYNVIMHLSGNIHILSAKEGGIKIKRVKNGLGFVGYTMDPLENLARKFDERLSKKIGPKPEEGWAALGGYTLEVLGQASTPVTP